VFRIILRLYRLRRLLFRVCRPDVGWSDTIDISLPDGTWISFSKNQFVICCL